MRSSVTKICRITMPARSHSNDVSRSVRSQTVGRPAEDHGKTPNIWHDLIRSVCSQALHEHAIYEGARVSTTSSDQPDQHYHKMPAARPHRICKITQDAHNHKRSCIIRTDMQDHVRSARAHNISSIMLDQQDHESAEVI